MLAILVILDHCFPLTASVTGNPLLGFAQYQAGTGELAVDLFFFISGFLITASWLNCKTMDDYLRRRILRICPGFIAAVIFSFLVATVFAVHPFTDLFQHLQKLDGTLVFIVSGLNGNWIFPGNPFAGTANGSLWTISWEFICYLIVAGLGVFGLFKRRVLILGIFILLLGVYVGAILNQLFILNSGCRFFGYFLAGTCAWLWRDKIILNNTFALLAIFMTLFAAQFPPYFNVLMPLTGCYLVLWVGFAFHIKSMAWCDKTDLSYGVYLFAFPIQQILAYGGIRNPWLMFALATPIVLGIAYFSWNYLEKPFLKLKSKDFQDYDPVSGTDSKQSMSANTSKVSW